MSLTISTVCSALAGDLGHSQVHRLGFCVRATGCSSASQSVARLLQSCASHCFTLPHLLKPVSAFPAVRDGAHGLGTSAIGGQTASVMCPILQSLAVMPPFGSELIGDVALRLRHVADHRHKCCACWPSHMLRSVQAAPLFVLLLLSNALASLAFMLECMGLKRLHSCCARCFSPVPQCMQLTILAYIETCTALQNLSQKALGSGNEHTTGACCSTPFSCHGAEKHSLNLWPILVS